MTKMAAMPIYGKNFQKSSPTELIVLSVIMKLVIEHNVLKLYKVYINYDPELTMTHFKTISNWAKLVCTYSRLRYQVSVYRAIGPLVYFVFCLKVNLLLHS